MVHHCENVVSKISFIYCLEGGGGGGELNWQVLRYSILCICKVPNLQLAEHSLLFLQNKIDLWCCQYLLFSQSTKPGLKWGESPVPGPY